MPEHEASFGGGYDKLNPYEIDKIQLPQSQLNEWGGDRSEWD